MLVHSKPSVIVKCYIDVHVCAGQDALSWFAQQPSVHWLSPHSTKRLHNWEGSAICQSAEAPPDAPVPLTEADGSHPFWSVGLTGSGQVVGGGDSGVGKCAHAFQSDQKFVLGAPRLALKEDSDQSAHVCSVCVGRHWL